MKPAIIILLFTISVSARMFPTYPDTGNRVKPIMTPIIQKKTSNSELTDVIGSRETYEETSVIESLKQMEFLLKDVTNDMVTSPEPPSTTLSTTKRKPSFQDAMRERYLKNKKRVRSTDSEVSVALAFIRLHSPHHEKPLLLLALLGSVLAYPTTNETLIDKPEMESENDSSLIVITEKMDFHEERQKYLRQVEERNQREWYELNKFWEESERLEQLEKEKKAAEDQKWFDDFNEFWNNASYVEEDRKAQETVSVQATERACLHLLFVRLCFWF
ncbi:hypothetical protein CRE_30272 [Caenorhabditis remanei]|uniref:Uncharacterized protein n=1 Tax=Caenorhabditis remanei TaxID=31234 RepID=E3NN87_CAERE|nr:hypothetical protein CRE_30272 [Caenorhabditis remanei]